MSILSVDSGDINIRIYNNVHYCIVIRNPLCILREVKPTSNVTDLTK